MTPPTRRPRAPLTFVLAVLATACASRDPDPADYDQTCASEQDCVLVFRRSCQCGCSCGEDPLGAVNRAEQERFNDDQPAPICPPRPPGLGCAVCDCAGNFPVATCVAGRCEAVLRDGGA